MVVISEIVLYHRGYNLQLQRQEIDALEQYVPSEFLSVHRKCGWGLVAHSRTSIEDHELWEHINKEAQRCSSAKPKTNYRHKVLVIGCSWTFGVGVPDNKTYVWLLNEKFPDIKFDNYGSCGWGTYQQLMLMQDLLPRKHYDLVLYAPIQDHINRNTRLRVSGQLEGNHRFVLDPRVEYKDEKLSYYPANSNDWPLQNDLLSVNFLRRVYFGRLMKENALETRRLPANKEIADNRCQAFCALLREMNKTAQQNNSGFSVMALDAIIYNITNQDPQRNFDLLDLSNSEMGTPKYHVKGNVRFHPNALAHRYWADVIEPYIMKYDWQKHRGTYLPGVKAKFSEQLSIPYEQNSGQLEQSRSTKTNT